MNEINKLTKESMKWVSETDSGRYFYTDAYDKGICWLRINDFPDEPLWTLFYKGDAINFDDKPENWVIVYKPE